MCRDSRDLIAAQDCASRDLSDVAQTRESMFVTLYIWVTPQRKGLMTKPTKTTLPGIVEEIIKSSVSGEPEKALIGIKGADDLIEEIRIVNTLTNDSGHEVGLEKGDAVKVIIKA